MWLPECECVEMCEPCRREALDALVHLIDSDPQVMKVMRSLADK